MSATLSATQEVIDLFAKFVTPNYTRRAAVLARGEGSEVWDVEGNRYLDLFPGWGCNLLGHCPPRVVEAVREQVGKLIHIPNTWYTEPQGRFAQMLVERSFPSTAFFCNSGAEANEAAIKLVRAHQAPKYKILTALGSFHGRTFAAVSATGQPKYQQGFGPIVPGFKHFPFGDIDAVRRLVDDETAAIMVEPIQGEGGVRPVPDGFLENLRQLCDERKMLLMLDEVQTGMGRTGEWFAYQRTNIIPDLMTLAKALAGGVACGAMLARPEIAKSLKPGMHAATFGGNPLACAAGIATVETIEADDLLAAARRIGDAFLKFFAKLQKTSSLIKEVRVIGAMIGVELNIPVGPVVEACLEKRLLVNGTQDTVLRLLPSLELREKQQQEAFGILEEVIHAAS